MLTKKNYSSPKVHIGARMTPPTIWSEINVSRLADQLAISRRAIYKWKGSDKGIPPERAIQIEQITGIRRERLRPDLWTKQINE